MNRKLIFLSVTGLILVVFIATTVLYKWPRGCRCAFVPGMAIRKSYQS